MYAHVEGKTHGMAFPFLLVFCAKFAVGKAED